MAGVDLVVGSLFTFIVACANKPRWVLARDIAVIVVIQLVALTYGAMSIWSGRPLYYAFSENVLQVVQAYDISPDEVDLARRQEAALAAHWYSLPRWIWAPLPPDSHERGRIVASAVAGGDDVISMPRYFKPWEQGLPALRTQLKKVDDVGYFSSADKNTFKAHLRPSDLSAHPATVMPLPGQGHPLLA